MGGITDALTQKGAVIMILKFQVLTLSELKYLPEILYIAP